MRTTRPLGVAGIVFTAMIEQGRLIGGWVPAEASEAGVQVGSDDLGVEDGLGKIEDVAGREG